MERLNVSEFYKKKREEEQRKSVESSARLHAKWREEEKNGSASSAINTQKQIRSWAEEAVNLSSAYAKEATSRNYMNITSSESSQFMMKQLADRAAKLQLDLEKNRSYLGDNYVKKAKEFLNSASGQNKLVSDALLKKQNVISQFKDQPEYERAVKDSDYRNMTSEERLAEADRLEKEDESRKKEIQDELHNLLYTSDAGSMTESQREQNHQRVKSLRAELNRLGSEASRIRVLDEQWNDADFLEGKSYAQIKAEEKSLEQQISEYRNRITEMMNSVSYFDDDEKKKQVQEERKQIEEKVDALDKKLDILKKNAYTVKMEEAVNAVPEDMKQWFYKNAEAKQTVDALDSPFDIIPAGKTLIENAKEYEKARQMVEKYAEETGQDIDLIKDYFKRQVSKDEAEVHAENMKAFTDDWLGAIAGSVYSVPATLFGGVSSTAGTAGNFIANLFREDDVPIDRYDKMFRHSDTADIIRGNVASNLGDVGGFFYQTGMSMLDSAATLPLEAVLPGSGLFLQGSAAASSSIRDTLDRGGTTEQALANGLASGLAEAVFEKIGIDELFKLKDTDSLKGMVKGVLKQSFTEGSEEVLTELTNRLTDDIIMTDKSAYNTRVKELIMSGMSEESAKNQADKEFIGQVASSFAGGALSGTIFGGGKTAYDYLSSEEHLQNKEIKKTERANKRAEKQAEKAKSETEQNPTAETDDPIMAAAFEKAQRDEMQESQTKSSYPRGIAKVGSHPLIQRVDGKTESPDAVSFESENQRKLYERASRFKTTAEANAFIKNYDGNESIDSYYSGYSAFSNAAQLYDSFDDVMKVDAYKKAANRIGKSVAKSAFLSSFNMQNNVTVSQQERAEIQKNGGVIRNFSVKPSRSVSAQLDALEIIGRKYKSAFEVVDTISGNRNGFYDPSTKRIVIALDADEGGIVRVASHELYHHIEAENAEDAAQIRSFVISALKAKSDYDYEAQKKWLMSKGYKESDVDSEITAQSMFDVFDADTIEKLRDENPSLLEKIRDWIDSFFKVLEEAIDRLSTKKYGGAEIRALRNDKETLSKIREMVMGALEKENQKKSERTDTQNRSDDVKFSVKDLSEQIEEIQNGTFPLGNNVYFGKTPKILADIGLNPDLPMLTPVRHIRKAMLPKNEKLHHHGLTKEQLSLLPQKIADPVMIMDSLNPNSNAVVVVTDMLDPDGMPVIAIVQADGKGTYNNIKVITNFVLSYYGRENFANFVQRNVNADTFLYINKEKSRKLSKNTKVQFFGNLNSYDFDTIIRKTDAKVNSKNEKSQIKSSIKDDSDVDVKALMRENKHLKEMLNLARGQLKRTKGHQVKPGTFEKLANKYKRQYGSRMETSEIASALQKMYDYIANGEEPNAEVAFDMAYDIAHDIVNQSKMTDPSLLQETKAVREHLRNTAVYFPEYVRNDINYSEIKSSLFGRLKIRNDGFPVDTYLAEIKEIFPEYASLPAESSTQAAKSLLSIVDGVYTEYVEATNEDVESAAAILASDIFNDYFEFEKKMFEKEVREKTAKKILEEIRQKRNEQKEKEEKRVHIGAITRNSERIMNRYLNPTNKRNIPNVFKQTVAETFKLIDFGDITFDRSQNQTIAREWKAAISGLRKLSETVENNESLDDAEKESIKQFLDPDTENKIQEINTAIQRVKNASGETVDISKRREIDVSTLKMIREITENIVTAINNYGEALSLERKQTIQELGEETIKENSGKYKSRNRFSDFVRSIWAIDSADINTFLTGLGEAGKKLLDSFRAGDKKKMTLLEEAFKFADSITKDALKKDKDFRKKLYSKKLITVSLDGKDIQLTKQQILSLYLLSKRKQALQHMIDGDGIIVGKMRFPVRVTMTELQKIFNDHLSNVDREFAKKLQEFLSTDVAEWGNEITRKEFGYDKFTEEFYFPISVFKNTIDTKDSSANENAGFYGLRNFGATKTVNRNATNALEISGAMDVFSDHITKMATYNAFALQTRDAMAWFNYRSKNGSVKRAMNDRYGDSHKAGENNEPAKSPSVKFFENFMLDLNNSSNKGMTETEKRLDKIVGRAKATMVAANIRVAIQQPTAIIRSFYYLNPKFFVKPVRPFKEFEQATKYSGAAKIKGYGFYENALSPQLATLIKGDQTIAEKVKDKSMILATKADEATWGMIWAASKQKALADNPSLKENSEEHLEAAGKIMDEVCYNTQVFDSILTQTGLMRSKNGFVKSLTAFTSEPAKFQNMILRAWYSGKKTEVLKTIFLGTVSNITAAAAASVIDAFRDDDDYKTWLEKYMDSLSGNVVQNLNPISAIPFGNDVWDIITGNFNSSSGVSPAILSDSAEKLMNYGVELVTTGQIDMSKAANDFVKAFSVATGIPLSNAEREVRTLWNSIVGAMGRRDLKWRTSEFYVTKDSALYEQLYQAQMNNDEKAIQRVTEELQIRDKTDSQIKSGLKKVAKDLFIGQIEEAAQAKADGDTSTYENILSEITEQSPLSRNDVQSLIDNAMKKLSSDEDSEESEQKENEIAAETDYSTTDIVKYVIDSGYSASSKKAIDSYYKGYCDKYVKEGKTEKEAKSKACGNIKSAITRFYKPQFANGSVSECEKIKKKLNEIKVDGKKIFSNTDYGKWKESAE